MNMKLYANNHLLAEQLLATAFALLRNEGLGPADAMETSYRLLTGGIDITPAQQAELHEYLRQVLADYDHQSLASPAAFGRDHRDDSKGDAK